ncbi:MAG: class I SAM-dependent methyltransferase [Candidatus Eisenbacteria bacterium]
MGRRQVSTDPGQKTYDRAYFDRWYRDPAQAVIQREHLARRVRLAVSAAEWVLDRPVESVLDIGAGEGSWRPVLKRLRPRARYLGLDPSAYAVRRFGRTRGLVQGGVGDLSTPALRREFTRRALRPPFDLVVCCDVLHYVPTKELTRGLKAIAHLIAGGGLAYVEFFTRDDSTEGDDEGFQDRSAATYARLFRAAGLTHLGLHSYVVRRSMGRELMRFEEGWAAGRPGRTR